LDIAVIIPELRKYGGAEKYLIECLRRWQDCHDITIYAIEISKKLLEEHGVIKAKLRKLTPYFEGEHGLLLNSVLLPKIWEKEIKKHDLYHTHLWPTHLLNLHPMVWVPQEPLRVINDLKFEQPLEVSNIQVSRKVHTYPKSTYDVISSKLYAANQSVISIFDKTGAPDRIVANSKYAAKYLSSVYNTEVVDVVYPGINMDDFFYQEPDENIIINVNQLWPHKRVNLLIEAMQFVENAHLYIVGEGPEKEVLIKQAQELGLSDRVFFMGNVTNEELAILYARALCAAFVPVREPFGIVALESLAAGKPLIAANEGGYTEVVNENNSFLIDPVPMKIAEKINYLVQNKNVAKEMGIAGFSTAGIYTWEKAAEQLISVIEDTYQKYQEKIVSPISEEKFMVGVDYFTWYGKGAGAAHWNDNPAYGAVNQKPLLGYYASDSGEIIKQHLTQLQNIGVDFLAANVHIDDEGLNIYQYGVTERILDIIETYNYKIKVCVQVCIFTTSFEKITKGIQEIVDNLINRKGYQTYRNKPMVWIFWTGLLDGEYETIASMKEQLEETTLLASSLRLYDKTNEEYKTFGLFDGWSLFSPLEVTYEEHREEVWNNLYHQYELGTKQIKIFTCSPGYDDTILEDPSREKNRLRYIDREDGLVFKKMLDFALDLQPSPDILKISTFNEFHENTNIEPTVQIGDKYMQILHESIQNFRKRS